VNCKPGQHALIINDHPELNGANLGREVIVVKAYGEHDGMFNWVVCVLPDSDKLKVLDMTDSRNTFYTRSAYHSDAWLMPLQPPDSSLLRLEAEPIVAARPQLVTTPV
jgi:hypothetical protein